MPVEFPSAVPEIPVGDIDKSLAYYESRLGFHVDWGGEEGGIAGISRDHCRIFLTNPGFREGYSNGKPVVVWLNLESKAEVDRLYEEWLQNGASIDAPPADKPWKLREFTARDLDGNALRVFYDFAWELRQGQ